MKAQPKRKGSRSASQRAGRMPRRPCPKRAKYWLPVKGDAKPLPDNEQRYCEYATEYRRQWKNGSSILYVCADHARELGRLW